MIYSKLFVNHFELCFIVSGSVFQIQRWTLICSAVLLMFVPLFVNITLAKPEPFKVSQ